MAVSRRMFLTGGGAALTLAAAPRAFAQWQPSPRYPDPAVQIVDPSFARYKLNLAKVERLATGFAGARARCGSATCAACSGATSPTTG